ncbi:MAG: aa3-type cytochrome oxidase subunit CtaJ [Pseudonocardiaceae bacterium]
MTSLEIILFLAGVPAAIMFLLALLTLRPNLRRTPRYRPGQAWNHPPVWWTANPEALNDAVAGQHNPPAADAERGGCRGDW